MPDEFERHARTSGDGYGGSPSRSQARRAAVQADTGAGRKPKNTMTLKKQCTGSSSPDGLHHGEPRITRGYQRKNESAPDRTCRWSPKYWVSRDETELSWWNCFHQEYCMHCGGKMNDTMGQRCPEFPGTSEKKAAAEQLTLEWQKEREARRPSSRQIRKTPNGPQGYRKPKPEN